MKNLQYEFAKYKYFEYEKGHKPSGFYSREEINLIIFLKF